MIFKLVPISVWDDKKVKQRLILKIPKHRSFGKNMNDFQRFQETELKKLKQLIN
jgi:hypothetical protein